MTASSSMILNDSLILAGSVSRSALLIILITISSHLNSATLPVPVTVAVARILVTAASKPFGVVSVAAGSMWRNAAAE